GSGAGRVAEGEETGKTRLPDELECFDEVLFGLSGKADDEIRGDGDLGPRPAHSVQDPEVVRAAVPPLHSIEDTIRAGLGRQMEVGRDVASRGERRDHFLVHEPRVGSQEAQALDARYGRRGGKQPPEAGSVLRVAV